MAAASDGRKCGGRRVGSVSNRESGSVWYRYRVRSAYLLRSRGGGGVGDERKERHVPQTSLHEPIPRRRRARLLHPFEEVEEGVLQDAQLDELDELGGAVVGQRARHRRVDVVHVDLIPPDEVLERLRRRRVEVEPAQQTQVRLDLLIQFLVRLLVQQLAVLLARRATEQGLAVLLEPAVEARQLVESYGGSGGNASAAGPASKRRSVG